MAALSPPNWLHRRQVVPDGPQPAIKITVGGPGPQCEPHPNWPAGWPAWERCPGNLAALLEFLSHRLRTFREAPQQPDYFTEQRKAGGRAATYVVQTPRPKHVFARLYLAWDGIKKSHCWLDHHGHFAGRPELPKAPIWPPDVLSRDELFATSGHVNDPTDVWSQQAHSILDDETLRIERALMELVNWVGTLAAVEAVPNSPNAEPSESVGAQPPPSQGCDSPTGFLGGADLAAALGVHATRRDAFFKRLERERRQLSDDCWLEPANRRPNSPQYLYRADDPKILKLAASYLHSKVT